MLHKLGTLQKAGQGIRNSWQHKSRVHCGNDFYGKHASRREGGRAKTRGRGSVRREERDNRCPREIGEAEEAAAEICRGRRRRSNDGGGGGGINDINDDVTGSDSDTNENAIS